MKLTPAAKRFIVVVLILLLGGMLYACVPYTEAYEDRYVIDDNDENFKYKDHQTRDGAVDRVTNGIDNLLEHLDQESIATQGYYIGADIIINSSDPVEGESAFILKLRANLYTLPYPEEPDPMEYPRQHDDPEYKKDLEQYKKDRDEYNATIKKSDIVLEWYDGMTNTMMIGFYFDGVNQNMADRGNNLYLNLLGDKRLFKDFGDSVLYQQLVRLLTQFDLDAILSSTTGDDSGSESANTLNKVLKMAVTNNYKQVLNGEEVSVYFDNVDLGTLTSTITEYLYNFFSPFEDKIDPLTYKYLGFKFSTLGKTTITTLNSDMQFFLLPLSYFGITSEGDKEILTGATVDLRGNSSVIRNVKQTLPNGSVTTVPQSFTVPFQSRISFEYSLHISPDIVIDKANYVLYEYGQYEFRGELFIPNDDQKEYELRLDALIRTDVNDYDNSKNRVFAEFRDKANDDLIIGLYYLDEPYIIKDQLTYIDIEGLQHLYGGIKFEDINLPKAYKGGFNLAELLKFVNETIDYYIVAMVDELLSPSEGSSYDNLTRVIMNNMTSTMKTKDDPTSRNTISIKIDMDLLREILKETNPTGGSYDNDQLIATVNELLGIDLQALASILGYDVKELIDSTWFYITYDVDEYSISIKMMRNVESLPGNSTQFMGSLLLMQLDLYPTKIGRKVKIVFPDFFNFKPLKKVMTYSGIIEGQVMFAMTEEVDLSKLMGAFIGDLSGLNTPYILPASADIYFRMYYDQYIREQILENGRWTRSSRSAFDIMFYAMEGNARTDLFRIYANDVSFNTASPIEELGYVWVDLMCIEGMPRMKVREDLFLEYFYEYMGYDITDTDNITLGFTDIVQALMDDSYIVFEPDVIRVTSSNQTLKNFFGVDSLLATMAIQIGFKQRVLNIDELEVYFAMYTVGELDNISGTSPYAVKLHDTIKVYFDFGTRIETKDFLILYDPASIAVANNQVHYYPTLQGRFMGVARSYTVTITGIEDAQRSEINSLVNDKESWEPLPVRQLPDKVRAYYGTSTYAYEYKDKVLYDFVGYYDRTLDYFIIPNEYGYEIVYDAKNDVFIVDLGTNYKFDKLFNVISDKETIYLKRITTKKGIELLYDIGSHYAGYYVVQNMPISILYYYPGGVEMIKKRQDVINENTGMVTQYLRREGFYLVEDESQITAATALLKDGGLVMAINMNKRFNTTGSAYVTATLQYDMGSGFFVVTNVVNSQGANVTPDYTVLYSPVGGALMYTSEEISLEVGVDPARNETKLVLGDFFLYNPMENAVINENNPIQTVISARRSQLLQTFGSSVTVASYYHVTTGSTQLYYMRYDMKTGLYVYDMTSGYSKYTVVYDNARYYVNKDATIADAVRQLMGLQLVQVDKGAAVNWDSLDRKNNKWEDVEKKAATFGTVDWSDRKWGGIQWGQMPIEVDENGYFTSPLEGGIFMVEVSIGKGMMATFKQYVTVHILNRTIDTDRYVNVTVNVEANKEAFPFTDYTTTPTLKVIAPVINADSPVQIDPYAYILLKANYVKDGHIPSEFITWLFAKYEINIRFTTVYGDERDTAPFIGKLNWYFDDPRGSQIYFREQDISNRVSTGSKDTTYLHTVFNGQVIALRLEVVSRTIDYLKFANEEYNGTYTVDAILESTYKIPQTPVICFEEKDENGNPYTLDLSNFGYRASTIFADFYRNFGVSMTTMDLKSPMSALEGFINWTNPVANNVKLVNVDGTRVVGDLNGDGVLEYPYEIRDLVRPFLGSNSDVNSSFFDIQRYVDPAASWFSEDWFASEIVTVIVLMPNKRVKDLTLQFEGQTFTASDISVQAGAPNGMFYLDPFDSATWTLPKYITVRFYNSETSYYTTQYPVVWDVDENVQIDFAGNATFRPDAIDMDPRYIIVSTRIGNERLGYIELKLLVKNLSGHIESYVFLGKDGSALAGSTDAQPSYPTSQGNAYVYEVNTYARFEVPSSVRILFSDGSTRTYTVRWDDHAPWKPGTEIVASGAIGSEITRKIPLVFRIADLTVNSITLNNHNPDTENLDIDIDNRRITVSGVNISNGLINGRTPYEYLFYLFAAVTLGFEEIPDTIVLTDAIESVKDIIFAMFDTQKVISANGQTYMIRLGQGAGADDCEVVFKASGAKVITDYTVVGDADRKGNYPMYDFRIYDDENRMSYPNGFAVGNELTIIVTYSDGTTEEFGPGTIPITRWVVAMPSDFTVDGVPVTEEESTMIGIGEGDIVEVISVVTLLDGGVVWLSAMLPDGSRVFVRLMAVSPEITDNYSSDLYVGNYAIVNGVITITDFYKVYPIWDDLTVDKLPTSIRVHNVGESIAGGILVENIIWRFTNDAPGILRTITYTGIEKFLLATAYIWGNRVELYLEVKDCTVTSISYTDVDSTKNFNGQVDVSTGRITVLFDAYHNRGYNGEFDLPNNLTVHFAGGGSHTLSSNSYYISTRTSRVTYLPYDYMGHTLDGSPEKYAYMRFSMPDGYQTVYFDIVFLDKTITKVIIGSDTEYPNDAGTYTIDPYGNDISVPRWIHIIFEEGAPLDINTTWSYPSNYEVKYDTYRRVLQYGLGYFPLETALAYGGITAQEIEARVYILDRVVESWRLLPDITLIDYSEEYSGVPGVSSANPNSYILFDDPFKARASQLPGRLLYTGQGNTDLMQMDIVWNFTDAMISSSGTLTRDAFDKYGIVYRGYIKNEEVGQPVFIRVYISRWEYQGIRKKLGGVYQLMSEEIRFFFSRLTERSTEDAYEIIIRKTTPSVNSPSTIVQNINIEFYPEDRDAPAGGEDYRIIWDAEAKAEAMKPGVIQSQGEFYLANGLGITKITPNRVAYYQFETPLITSLNMGYGYGDQNKAIYVANPFDFYRNMTELPGTDYYYIEAQAKGIKEQVADSDMGIVRVMFNRNHFNDPAALAQYVKGGIYAGYTVIVEYRETVGDRVYVRNQEFNIMLVFLDMSPTDEINILAKDLASMSTLPNTLTSLVKAEYELDTYDYAPYNPYRENYATVRYALNMAAAAMFPTTQTRAYTYLITWQYTLQELQSMAAGLTQNLTVYSTYVTVNNRIYATNFVRMVIVEPYVTHLDMGFGMGEEGEAVYVLNPFELTWGMTQIAGNTYYVEGTAKGIKATLPDKSFGAVRVIFDLNLLANTTIINPYVAGGIMDNFTVTVEYEDEVLGRTYTYTQSFNIRLVFLDMSAETGLTISQADIMVDGSGLPAAHTARVKRVYDANTYAGQANPYGSSYSTIMEALNLKAAMMFPTDAAATYEYTAIIWEESLEQLRNITETKTVYSQYVTVGGRTYRSNVVKLTVTV
ncbi:MAG: hypothetical protein GX095_04270 [Clostridiales bacterium]|nr:hypothetical protein [Clostridiales bacterium]